MRFQDWLDNKYITISEKKKRETEMLKNKEINNLLERINKEIERYGYIFDISEKYKSPSTVLKIDKKKLDKIVQKWLLANEELEEIKIKYKNGLH